MVNLVIEVSRVRANSINIAQAITNNKGLMEGWEEGEKWRRGEGKEQQKGQRGKYKNANVIYKKKEKGKKRGLFERQGRFRKWKEGRRREANKEIRNIIKVKDEKVKKNVRAGGGKEEKKKENREWKEAAVKQCKEKKRTTKDSLNSEGTWQKWPLGKHYSTSAYNQLSKCNNMMPLNQGSAIKGHKGSTRPMPTLFYNL